MKLPTIGLVAVLLAFGACSQAPGEPQARTPSIMAHGGVALDGYDPVSYFDGKPRRGEEAYRVESLGVTWVFADQRHLDRFQAAPEAFVPQYGGHCALAMSLNEVAEGSPESWSIIDGKLYFHNSGLTSWLFSIIPGRIGAADENWAQLKKTAMR